MNRARKTHRKSHRKTHRKSHKKTHRKSHRKTYSGGSNFRTSWVGIPNIQQPTGFGWSYKSFLKPCNN